MAEREHSAQIEDLLVHADWLRRLAGRLARDDDPEDLVQDTWTAALRSPPSTDRPTAPWLREVLRNLVQKRWRAARVRARAAIRADAAAPSPQDLLERARLQRELAELVLELDEPYRTAILLRYYEGRNAAEIARALGIPAGTMRWRLSQAVQRLRERLDARHGSREVWRGVLLPLAEGRAPVAGPETTVLGGMLTSTAGKLATGGVLAVLLGLGATAIWRSRTGEEDASMMIPRVDSQLRSAVALEGKETGVAAGGLEGKVRDRSRPRPGAGPSLVEPSPAQSAPAQPPAPARRSSSGPPPRTPPKFVESPKPRFIPKAKNQLEKQRGDLVGLFEAEKRHRVWAPAMEQILKERFHELARENGTPGFKLTEVDCRESACRLDMEYQPADVEVARAAGAIDPYFMARDKAGAFASVSYLVKAPPEYAKSLDPKAWVQPDGSIRKKLVLLFGDEDIDPDTYVETTEGWARRERERTAR